MRVELSVDDTDELAQELSRWRPEQVIELIKQTDEYMGEWDLALGIKEWADELAKEHAREVAIDRRDAGHCYVDPDTGQEVHQRPEKECLPR